MVLQTEEGDFNKRINRQTVKKYQEDDTSRGRGNSASEILCSYIKRKFISLTNQPENCVSDIAKKKRSEVHK